ncbi:MAG: glycosyltransferase [bacterium]|nr:glycosyltransferase [bacterium]
MSISLTPARKRILVIKRDFWPHMSDATLRLLTWCHIWAEQGIDVSVLTNRPGKHWPAQITINRLQVFRVDGGNGNPLRNMRFGRNVKSWIQSAERDFDLIYFDEPSDLATQLLTSLSDSIAPATVLRYAVQSRISSPARGWPAVRAGLLSNKNLIAACQKATAVLVPDAISHQQLLSEGLVDANIIRGELTIPKRIDRNIGNRREARRLLAEANHDLFTRASDRIVLCPSDDADAWNLDLLVNAVGPLSDVHRNLRVWMLGDGQGRVYDRIRQQGWHHALIQPGVFTDLEPLIQAADLCVFPGMGSGLSWLMPSCMVSGLPMLAADSKQTRSIFDGLPPELLFEANSAGDLHQRLVLWLRDPTRFEKATLEMQNRLTAKAAQRNSECDRILSLIQAKFAPT